MAKRRKNHQRRQPKYEFKPDRSGTGILKKLVLTKVQQRRLLKWSLLTLVCLTLLVLQDSVLSRVRFHGATTDLAVAAILLISMFEGTENGSLFVLLASTVYQLSGSAPGPYVIAILTFLIVGATLLRQMVWRKNYGSILLCTWVCIMVYELAVFAVGIFIGRTIWPRISVYALTGLLSCLVTVPLYPLVRCISAISGDPWKE